MMFRAILVTATFGMLLLNCGDANGPGSVPSTPKNVRASAQNSSMLLSWSPQSDGLSFLVYRSTDKKNFSVAGTTLDTFFVDTGLTPSTIYYYKVRCGNEAGLSEPCAMITARFSGGTVGAYQLVIDKIYQNLPQHRGLDFDHQVKAVVLTREEYAQQVSQEIRSYYTPEEDRAITRQLVQLGYQKDTTETFVESYSAFSSDFAAAFYRKETDSVYLIEPQGMDQELLESYYLPHEFTHVLQEQHFNPFSSYLWPVNTYSRYNSDYYLAQRCVYEGDAVLASYSYLYAFESMASDPFGEAIEKMNKWRDRFYDSLSVTSGDRYNDIRSDAPYDLGSHFISNIFKDGGWSAVNDLYLKNRVKSSSHIVTGTAVEPVRWDFSALYTTLLTTSERPIYVDDDSYGPVLLMALFDGKTDTQHASNAFGWRGDHLLYFTDSNNRWGSLLWKVSCATETDASYLLGRFDKIISERSLDGVTATRTATSDSIYYVYPNVFSTILRRSGTEVTWTENLPWNTLQMALSITPVAAAAKSTATTRASDDCYLDPHKKSRIIDFIVDRGLHYPGN